MIYVSDSQEDQMCVICSCRDILFSFHVSLISLYYYLRILNLGFFILSRRMSVGNVPFL